MNGVFSRENNYTCASNSPKSKPCFVCKISKKNSTHIFYCCSRHVVLRWPLCPIAHEKRLTSSPISQWMSSLLQIYCFQLVIIFGHARTRRSSCVTRQCSAYKTSRSCKTALAPACVTDVGLRPNDTKKSIKVKKKRKKYKTGVTLSIIIICKKRNLSPLPIKKLPKKV